MVDDETHRIIITSSSNVRTLKLKTKDAYPYVRHDATRELVVLLVLEAQQGRDGGTVIFL